MLPFKKHFICLSCFLLLNSFFYSQGEPNGLVNWMSLKEAQEKNKVLEKPFLIDIYTDWCGWCKHMMKTTYSNQGIANYINTNFYAVKFDAETKDTIEFNGTVYKPLSKDPKTPHELAIKFLGNNLSYPSTVFMTNNYQYSLLSQGYIEDKKIEPLLIFMVENVWRTVAFDEFNKHFLNTFYDTNYPKIPVLKRNVNELELLQKKKAKKVLINLSAGFCNSGRVMSLTTYNDTSMAKELNKNFYFVDFDVTTNDTIVFKNEKYYKVMVNGFPIHSLALKLSNNRFSLPSVCILEENLNFIEVLNYYQSPEKMKPILKYIASNSYKSKSYELYLAEEAKSKLPSKSKK